MNDERRPEPLPDNTRDELLSADLDGELAAAAADLGLSPEAARRRITATPGADERRRELAAARAMGAHVDDVDELVAARLRATALRASAEAQATRARARRRGRRLVRGAAAAVAAAAAVLVAVAIVATLARSNTHDTNSSSAAPVASPSSKPNAPAPSERVAPLGSYADVQSLTVAVSDSIRRDRFAADGLQQSDAGVASPPAASGRCAAQFDRLGGGTGEPVVDSSALVAGRPVYVRAYIQKGATLVLVLNGECQLLTRRVDTH